MAQAVAAVAPIIGKVLIGFAASTLVSKITGNQLLGTIAGGLLGGGLAVNSATGAMSWSAGNVAGAFGGNGAKAGLSFANAVPGGTDLLNLGAEAGSSAFGLAGDASGAFGLASAPGAMSAGNMIAGNVGGSNLLAAPAASISAPAQAAVNQGGNVLAGGAAPRSALEAVTEATKAGGGGIFDKLNSFLSDNAGLVNIGAKMLAGAMDDPVQEALDIHKGKMENLAEFQNKGYTSPTMAAPSGPVLQDRIDARIAQGFEPYYSRKQDPNYRRMIETLRNQDREEVA